MRIIKFKVWDKIGKRMWSFNNFDINLISNDCMKDFENPNGNSMFITIGYNPIIDYNQIADSCNNKDRFIPIQFTGKKDKNKVDIYDGNIMKVKYCSCNDNKEDMILKSNCVEFIGEVKFIDGSFWVISKGYKLLLPMFERLEVIGNIYQKSKLKNSPCGINGANSE